MSYLVLARKYRPQTFEEVVEQKQVTQTLKNAIESGRVAHAILFSGPRGTGKTTIARILAKAMNCEKGPAPKPCNACRSCVEITSGSSADVFEIDGASNNSVEQVRELRENARFMPAHSPYKIYIIDEVHMLSKSAFNALLKTLEEPPAHVLFFFATTEPHRVPVTILSRCQRHDLSYISIDPIVAHLKMICGKEGVKADEKSLELIARESGGSVRDALSLLDQVMSFSSEEITSEAVSQILGILDNETLFALSDSIFRRDLKKTIEILDEVYRSGHEMKKFYSEIMTHFRNLLVVKLGATGELTASMPSSEVKRLSEQSAQMDEQFLTQALSLMMADEEKVRLSAAPKIAVEMVFIKLVHTARPLPVDTLIKKIDELKDRFAALASGNETPSSQACRPSTREEEKSKAYASYQERPSDNPRPQAEKTANGLYTDRNLQAAEEASRQGGCPGKTEASAAPNAGMDNASTWEAILSMIDERYPLLAANLNNSTLAAIKGDRLEIKVYGSKTNKAILQRKQSLENLKKACSDFFKKEMEVVINYNTKDTDGTKEEGKENPLERRQGPHPMVMEVLDIFGGKIVKT